MKESDEKEKNTQPPSNDDIEEVLKWWEEKLKEDGIPLSRHPNNEYRVLLNPPKSLVDKLRKEKGDKKGS